MALKDWFEDGSIVRGIAWMLALVFFIFKVEPHIPGIPQGVGQLIGAVIFAPIVYIIYKLVLRGVRSVDCSECNRRATSKSTTSETPPSGD